jgi:hypothetical protein
MKISPDGTKIITSGAAKLELFDFDYLTGLVYNPRILSNSMGGYGGAFSPDGSKYYSAGTQYDLNAANPAASSVPLGISIVSDMRLAPDGKIYFKSPVQQTYTFLGRINNPNAAGLACNVQDSVTALSYPLTGLTYGLPNEVVVADPNYEIASGRIDTLICDMPPGGLVLYTTGTFRVWDDGSNGATRIVTEPGTYYVYSMSGSCKAHLDSFVVKGLIKPAEIVFNNPLLSTTHTYDSYQWYKDGNAISGGINQSLYITHNGWYSVVVHDQWGCSDSTAFKVSTFTSIDDATALKQWIKTYPNPAHDVVHVDAPFPVSLSLYTVEGKLLFHSNKKTVDISPLAAGFYLLRIEDKDGRLIDVRKIGKL